MAAQRLELFRVALETNSEVTLYVANRRSGRRMPLTLWFVHAPEMLYLLPANGERTDWYRHVQAKSVVEVRAGDIQIEARARAIGDRALAERVRSQVAAKYVDGDVSRYYHDVDVVVLIPLTT